MNESQRDRTFEKMEEEIKVIGTRVTKLEIESALSKNDYRHILTSQDKSMKMLEELMDQVNSIEKKPVKRYELIVDTIIKIVAGAAAGYFMSGMV